MRVGGLDLARRRDFSALVTLDVTAEGATVTRALRLPQAPYREQLDLIAPLVADLDDLAFDAGGIGDAIGEHLPPDAIPIVIVGGDGSPRLHQGRWRIGKVLLIQNVLVLAGRGRLVVPASAPGAKALREELKQFGAAPTRRGTRMAAKGQAHDDLVLALALAVIAARLCLDGIEFNSRCRIDHPRGVLDVGACAGRQPCSDKSDPQWTPK